MSLELEVHFRGKRPNIPGVELQTPRANWPLEKFGNNTELFLHALISNGPQAVSALRHMAPHIDQDSTRAALQRAIEQGTVRPLSASRTQPFYRITNKGRWALRNHWAWRRRYPLEEFPEESEDEYGMRVHKGRPPLPKPLTRLQN